MDGENALLRSLLTGVAVFRWLAWAWLAVVLFVGRDDLSHPVVATLLAGAALVVTVTVTGLGRTAPSVLLRPPMIALEVAVGVALSVGDGYVYDGAHSQSLGSAWPLAGILSAGIAFAVPGGVVAGVVVGLGRLGGKLLDEAVHWTRDDVLSVVSTIVLYALAGAVAGYATRRLREAERSVAMARAREEVARTLHDGVLQTLAVVQRRAGDDQLVQLAREQEQDLREYLFGTGSAQGGGDVGARLRRTAQHVERRHGLPVSVVVTEDVGLTQTRLEALAGAVGEALTNAAKHAGATRVTVYAEPDGRGVFCSVKDDGAGFDPEAVARGVGLDRSITARVEEVGGRVEIAGNPGHGTEIRLWL